MSTAVVRPLPAAMLALTCVVAVAAVPLSAGLLSTYDTVLYALNAVAVGLAGALIASRQPGNTIGWLLCGMGVAAAFVEFAEGYGAHVALPAAVPAQSVGAAGSLLSVGLTTVVLLLFPSGRVPSPRWRPVLWIAIAATMLMVVGTALGHSSDDAFGSGSNPYAVDSPVITWVYVAGQLTFTFSLLAAIGSLVVRYRRASGVERDQLKWVAYVVTALALTAPFAVFFYWDSVVVQIVIAVVVTALPAAICVAILRYRLYGINVIINRTVVYGLLTLLLAVGYAAIALVLGTAFGGSYSPWVTAAATLAVAAAFRPLRGRIQDAVDRRFRRARYDALGRIDTFLEDLRAGRAAPEMLPSLLAEVLSLPDLELRYLLPGRPGEGDGAVTAGVGPDGRIRTLVERAGVPLAVVVYSPPPAASGSAEIEPQLVQEVLAHAGLAIEIARLRAEVEHQLSEVEASRARIVAAGYEERRRLERDLHDGAQQRLVSIGLALRHAQHQLGPSPVSQSIEDAVDQISVAIADLRELANGVRPAQMDNGLDFALRELASRTPLPVQVNASTERFDGDVEATAYFVACEAVTNAVKHAAATGVEVLAERLDGHLVLTVRDDGVGGAEPLRGSGLRGLSDRVSAQGGRIRVISPRGHGTTLTAELPCAS